MPNAPSSSTPAETRLENKTAPRSPLRRIMRGVGWTFLVLFCLIALVVGFIHTSWGKEVVRGRVEKALAKRVTGQLTLEAVDYGFMFGDVELRGLRIHDADEKLAIGVDRLFVDLDRGSLLSERAVLSEVAIDGGQVNIRKNADGTSNLTGLFVPSKRAGRRITIEALRLAGFSVQISKPDGSLTRVTDIGVGGRIEVDSIDRQFVVELNEIGAAALIKRADGVSIDLPKTVTSLRATVSGHNINASIEPIGAIAKLTTPARGEMPVSLHMSKIELSKTGGRLKTSLAELRAGPLAITGLTAETERRDGQLQGTQRFILESASVSHEELASLLGKSVLASDISLGARIEGPPSLLKLSGSVNTAGGDVSLRGSINASELARPSYELHAEGNAIRTDAVVAPRLRQGRPSLESSLRIALRGTGIPRRAGSVSSIELSVQPSKLTHEGKTLSVDQVEIAARLEGRAIAVDSLRLRALGLDVQGKVAIGGTRTLDASVGVTGNARAAVGKLRELGLKIRPLPVALPTDLDLKVKATGHLDGAIALEVSPTTIALAGGSVRVSGRAELETVAGKRKLSRADLDLTLSRLAIGRLVRIAKKTTKLRGAISGTASVHQRGAARDVEFDVRANLAEPEVTVKARGSLGSRELRATASVVKDGGGVELVRISAALPLTARRKINPTGKFALRLDVDKRELAELESLLPAETVAKLKQRVDGGAIALSVDLHGTPSAPHGSISIGARAAVQRLHGRKVGADIGLTVYARAGKRVGLKVDEGEISLGGISGPLATLAGEIHLGPLFKRGAFDREGLRSGASLSDLSLTVPRREISSFAELRPALADLSGTIGLTARASGQLADPRLRVDGGWHDYKTVTDATNAIDFELVGRPSELGFKAFIGRDRNVSVDAEVKRRNEELDLIVRANASKASLEERLPIQARGHGLAIEYGELDSDLVVKARRTADGFDLKSVDVRGALAITGAGVGIPNSKRRYHDVGLRVEGDGPIVRLVDLSAHESDEEKSDRSLKLSAMASFANGRPNQVSAKLHARDWLVFGGSMGQSDAPRATLGADIDVGVNLAGDRPVIDATLNSLRFRAPDRSLHDHGLEAVAASADVMMIDESAIGVGKLGVVRVQSDDLAPAKRRPMLVRLHIPNPIEVEKTPLAIKVSGDLSVDISDEGIRPNGKLKVHDGVVALFGHPHAYEKGSIVFDENNPRGALSLVFARELSAATLRQLSKKSGGRAVRITIAGSAAKRKIILSGAGNSGMLEVMSAHNAGRGYYFTRPDVPATSTVQAPQLLQPLVLTYLAMNLPHMLVLDRFSAWSDPPERARPYGQVSNFVGERTSSDTRSRARVVARSRVLGRSGTEIQLDRVLVNNAALAFGAGVRVGSRLGGGIAVFLEWASAD